MEDNVIEILENKHTCEFLHHYALKHCRRQMSPERTCNLAPEGRRGLSFY